MINNSAKLLCYIVLLLVAAQPAKAAKGYISTEPAADSDQTVIVAKNGKVTFVVNNGVDAVNSCSGSFPGATPSSASIAGSLDVTFGPDTVGNTTECAITISTSSATGQTCTSSKTIHFHVIVPGVTIDRLAVCDGSQFVTLDLVPTGNPKIKGTLSVKASSSGSDTEIVNTPDQAGATGFTPTIDFSKFPTAHTSWDTLKARWTVNSVNIDADNLSTEFDSKQMDCTGYYTALDTAFSGSNGSFFVGATEYPCHQSFLDAIARVNGGAVEVDEGVGLLTANSGTYYHFAKGDQVMDSSHTHIIKYVATSNDHDGDCGGGHQLKANHSVAKMNSSAYFDCGTQLYIQGNDGDVAGKCHVVEDGGHQEDSPDIFQGQGGPSLNNGPGSEIVLW